MLFGIEIELVGLDREQVQRLLEQAGIDCGISRSHNNVGRTSSWKVVPDGSVCGGCEIVSPPLELNQASFALIRKVCEVVNDAGADVNRSCGLHVHFDASALTHAHIANINNRYGAFEHHIDKLMARSRRGDENRFCKSIRQRQVTAQCLSHSDASEAVRSRYYKLNLASLYKHGTIEFRQHQGTINASKIIKWVEFLNQFIVASAPVVGPDNSAQLEALYQAQLEAFELEQTIWFERQEELRKIRVALTASGKRGQIIQMMRSGISYTADQIASIVGTTRASVQSTVSTLRRDGVQIQGNANSGYQLESTTELGPRPVRPIRSVSHAAVSLRADDNLWHGIDSNLKEYYERRAYVLSTAS